MITIVKSVLGSTDDQHFVIIDTILDTCSRELNPQEQAVFQYLHTGFSTYKQFPTEELFKKKFPEYSIALGDVSPLSLESLDYYKKEFIERHKRAAVSKKLLGIASNLQQTGLTSDIVESLRNSITNNESVDSLKTSNVVDLYEEAKANNYVGIKTYVPELDQLIGTIDEGTLTVIAGYNGHGKTTWAVNMMYKAAREGKHVVYISLEVTERDLLYGLISLHSNDPKFGRPPIPVASLRRRLLDEKQEKEFVEVAEDFNNTILPNIRILTDRNFKDFSYGEVREILYTLDAQSKIDVLFLDHANLLKYYVKTRYTNTGDAINEYVSFFRGLALCFKVENGVERHLTIILLAQCNRAGYTKALEAGRKDQTKEGRYDDTAVSESHELSRSATYIMTVYASGSMKLASEARVQLLKSRWGQIQEDPIVVSFHPENYLFGDFSDHSVTTLASSNMDSPYESFIGLNPSNFGMGGLGGIGSLGTIDFS